MSLNDDELKWFQAAASQQQLELQEGRQNKAALYQSSEQLTAWLDTQLQGVRPPCYKHRMIATLVTACWRYQEAGGHPRCKRALIIGQDAQCVIRVWDGSGKTQKVSYVDDSGVELMSWKECVAARSAGLYCYPVEGIYEGMKQRSMGGKNPSSEEERTNVARRQVCRKDSTMEVILEEGEVEWLEGVLVEQSMLASRLGDRDWDALAKHELLLLKKKIAFAMYGKPGQLPETDGEDIGYTAQQMKAVNNVHDKLVGFQESTSDEVLFACIFVCGYYKQEGFRVAVFRTTTSQYSETVTFIDSTGRVYKCWQDYLEDNQLPACLCCYPKDGCYDNEAITMQLGMSPAGSIKSKVLLGIDITTAVAGLASMGVMAATLLTLPIAAPVVVVAGGVAAATSVYSAGRSGYKLYDKASHQESIAPHREGAIYEWIVILSSSFGLARFGALASISRAAAAGRDISKVASVTYMALSLGCLTVNGLGVVADIVGLIDKKKNKELTPLDLFQFTMSVLFFCNDVVSIKTAGSIVAEIQNTVIDKHRTGLSQAERRSFRNMKKRAMRQSRQRGQDPGVGRAKVVRRVNRVDGFPGLVGHGNKPPAAGIDEQVLNLLDVLGLDESRHEEEQEDDDSED